MNGELEAGEIEERLAELERAELSASAAPRLRSARGRLSCSTGEPVLLLCSNNYLGLADHPRVREAAAEAAMRWGVGTGASRLISGTMTVHRRWRSAWRGLPAGSRACCLARATWRTSA